MKQKTLYQGAEAIIYQKDNLVIKDRISKSYRLKQLDEKIRKSRTKSEIKLLTKASKLINAPVPLKSEDFARTNLLQKDRRIDNSSGGLGEHFQLSNRNMIKLKVGVGYCVSNSYNEKLSKNKTKIIMPYIKGKKLSEHLDNFKPKQQKQICKQIGQSLAKIHDEDLIHGDLTTSNMILAESSKKEFLLDKPMQTPKAFEGGQGGITNKNSQTAEQNKSKDKLFLIDFGLGFHSARIEDKAVDLHLIKQALEAKHFQNWKTHYQNILQGYKKSKNYKKTLEQLKKVEARGRYKGK